MDNHDCLVEILGRCNLSDLASASCVSKSWNAAARQVLDDLDVDGMLVGSHRLDSCTVMLARSISFLEISQITEWEDTRSYVDVDESHGRVACIDDGGCIHVCARDGRELIHVSSIPGDTTYSSKTDFDWNVFVLGGTRNILSILPNHCIKVYVEYKDSHYRLKDTFWPTCLESQSTLKFCIEESDPQYLYVGCRAGKVLQLDVFNQGAVSRVFRPDADGDVTALAAGTVYGSRILLVATTDDDKIPCITLIDCEESMTTLSCPSNTRYKELWHLDISTDSQHPLVLGTCENMLLVWRILSKKTADGRKLHLRYVTQTRTTIMLSMSHSFLPHVCDEDGNVYACGMVDSSVNIYKITSDGIEQIHHVPVFGFDPMEHVKMKMERITKILWKQYPAVFLAGPSAGLVLLPKKHHRFSRPSSFLHLAFL